MLNMFFSVLCKHLGGLVRLFDDGVRDASCGYCLARHYAAHDNGVCQGEAARCCSSGWLRCCDPAVVVMLTGIFPEYIGGSPAAQTSVLYVAGVAIT